MQLHSFERVLDLENILAFVIQSCERCRPPWINNEALILFVTTYMHQWLVDHNLAFNKLLLRDSLVYLVYLEI